MTYPKFERKDMRAMSGFGGDEVWISSSQRITRFRKRSLGEEDSTPWKSYS